MTDLNEAVIRFADAIHDTGNFEDVSLVWPVNESINPAVIVRAWDRTAFRVTVEILAQP